MDGTVRVTQADALLEAVKSGTPSIEVAGTIEKLRSFELPPRTRLHGADHKAQLHFVPGQPGLMLTADNAVQNLRIVTDDTQVAVGLADRAEDLGVIEVIDVRTFGRFHLEAAEAKRGHLSIDRVHVEQADARLAAHRPAGFGVEVLLGGLTIYNASKDPASRWTMEARHLSGGSRATPLQGSGVFVFGGWFISPGEDMAKAPAPTQAGGTIELRVLTTGEVHSKGGIPRGIGNLITGGVFVGSGVDAQSVVSEGPVFTYGPNDMVLDNWGKVSSWVANGDLTSFESSGIGFVNFGDIGSLDIRAPIITHGLGARGFNLYDGTLKEASFQDITTHGDGAIGVQLSKPFGRITIHGNVATKGGSGDSLVRGRVVHLAAHALSLKPGAQGESLRIAGTAVAQNPDITDLDFEAPASVIGLLEINGKRLR